MNILFIFPPQWVPFQPHFAIPSLMGQFKGLEYNTTALDLNLEFFLRILNKEYLNKSIEEARNIEKELYEFAQKTYRKDFDYDNCDIEIKNKLTKFVMIHQFFQKNEKELPKYPFLISDAINILRSKEYFYNPKLLVDALSLIDKSLEIASLKYAPSKLSLSNFYNQNFQYNFKSIKYFVDDKTTNIFYPFFLEKLDFLKSKKADYIGISINSSSQIIAGLTLSKLLKENTNAHISIGGNYFARITENLKKYPEFFEIFTDSLMFEEGEKPVLELAEYINKKRKIKDVSNIMYLQNGKVKINKKTVPMPLNEMKPISLDGFELDKYFTPEIVMPFQTSRGCYWHKCSFCDHDFGLCYNIKSVDKLIDEIKFLKSEYNINKFEFIDEAISPKYMKDMAQKLLDEKIDVSYFCDARLEPEFTLPILKKARKSGLRMLLWGLESGSKKIMDLINKGVPFDKRIDIMRNAAKADILNFAFIFFGFPAETKEDAFKTIKLIQDNADIIHAYGRSVFTMGKHALIRKDPVKYGVKGKIKQLDEFSPTYSFKAKGMTEKELSEVINVCTSMAMNTYGNNLIFKLVSRELIFLYLCKFGLKEVVNYRF